ncbi:MAG: DivIVA domain-containing protein [Actinomycetales bacterium]|nr:MAG: DivIVA domain-containing protein [Actinomycetales bacterium]
MMWLVLLLAVVLIGVTAAAMLGRIDGSLADPTAPLSYLPLPSDRLTSDDLDALRIDTALRGYRMDQVDEVIDRLVREIDVLHGQVEWLSHRAAPGPTESPEVPEDPKVTKASETPEPRAALSDPRAVDEG